jgi:hypothetical protein
MGRRFRPCPSQISKRISKGVQLYQSCDGVTEIAAGDVVPLASTRPTIATATTFRHPRAKIKSKVPQHWWLLAPRMIYNISGKVLLEFQHRGSSGRQQ